MNPGQREVIREAAPDTLDFTSRRYRHRGVAQATEKKARNRTSPKVRAKIGHCVGAVKRVFGFTKARYQGLEKHAHQPFVACELANPLLVSNKTLRTRQATCVRNTVHGRRRRQNDGKFARIEAFLNYPLTTGAI